MLGKLVFFSFLVSHSKHAKEKGCMEECAFVCSVSGQTMDASLAVADSRFVLYCVYDIFIFLYGSNVFVFVFMCIEYSCICIYMYLMY